MPKMDTLQKYFPTGTTEGDRQLLDRIFIAPEQLPEVLAISSGSPRLLVGNKGVGKTAILEWLIAAATKRQIPAILIRPDDLDLSGLSQASDVATLKRSMYECFLDAVGTTIGKSLNGFLTGPAAKLYQDSVRKGARDEDWMGKLLTLLNSVSQPVTKIDGKKLANELSHQTLSTDRLTEIIRTYLFSEKSLFLLLFDDTDQVASLDDAHHLNRIWGLLLAVRKLASECPNVKCVVTLRTEVWMRLLRNEHGQRDQIDHFRPLVLMLRAPEQLIKSIFSKRLNLAAKEGNFVGQDRLRHFFEDEWMTLPMREERRTWPQFLVKSSRERPRDMIQLVNHLAEAAKRRGAEQIGAKDAEKAMETYSKERAEDLAIEMGFDCPAFLDVLRSFVDLNFELSFEELRAHLLAVPSRFALQIGGRTIKPNDDDGAILLLSLLHESGFINAKVPDSRQTQNYRHINFLDDPHLVQNSRWNELQGARWEIHPAFRTYLISIGRERSWR